ncbi:MAG TPA: hypothetical protein VM146_11460 [Steroidobacteraceae bacterium]|nr:hypothetical protein [Steroidobacteraceae bacterium]
MSWREVAILIAVSTALVALALALRVGDPMPHASRARVDGGVTAPPLALTSMPAGRARAPSEPRERIRAEGPKSVAPVQEAETAAMATRRRAAIALVVRDSHGALIHDLHVSPRQRDALLAVLAELEDAQSISKTKSGRAVSRNERETRIASVLGTGLAAKFFELERRLPAYWELGQAAAALERGGAPLSETQREGLLAIFSDTQVSTGEPVRDPDPVNELARELGAKDEYERLVLELAPSVLGAKQTRLLFEQFESRSARRAESLLANRYHASENGEDTPVWYPVF